MVARITPLELRRSLRRKSAGHPARASRWLRKNLGTITLSLCVAVMVWLYCYVGWKLFLEPKRIRCAEPQNCRESFGGPARGSEVE